MSAVQKVYQTSCPKCQNGRMVYSRTLKRKVRCPACTYRKPDRTGKHLRLLSETSKRELSGAEAQRISRAIASHVAQSLIDKLGIPRLPEHLVTTDRILQRWAAMPSGLPAENEDLYHITRPPQLDPRTHEAVGDVIKSLSAGARRFVFEWYAKDWPPTIMAKDRYMSVRQLGREWLRVLVIIRDKFLASPHADLARLVRALP